jgi:hypothetical protein
MGWIVDALKKVVVSIPTVDMTLKCSRLNCCVHYQGSILRKPVPQERCCLPTVIRDDIHQKTIIHIFIVVKTSTSNMIKTVKQ